MMSFSPPKITGFLGLKGTEKDEQEVKGRLRGGQERSWLHRGLHLIAHHCLQESFP